MMRSPLIGWMFARGACDEIILVPSDLRTPDPSFLDEISAGSLGLGGETVQVGSGSPFAGTLGGGAWTRELHGFGWLNHLTVAEEEGRKIACRLVDDWIQRAAEHGDAAWSLDVLSRRVISWITHSDLVLIDAEADHRNRFMRSLGRQLHLLDIQRREAAPGPDNLTALTALLLADLAIDARDERLARTERAFLAELKAQVLPDGGHVSRNPIVVLDLILDLLPLRRCYIARERIPPDQLVSTIDTMLAFLRAMRLGNGMLGCFNGAGAAAVDALATALSIDGHTTLSTLRASGYARAEAGSVVVLMDCGLPPLPELSRDAAAGCLSFEMSDGDAMVIVNGGLLPSHSHGDRAAARATINHSVLSIDGKSSGQLVTYRALGLTDEMSALAGPRSVGLTRSETDTQLVIEAWHDGYLASHELIHGRKLAISKDGAWIEGIDSLKGRSNDFRLRQDVPFAIRFHLAADSDARIIGAGKPAAELTLANGVKWTMIAEGAELGIEASPSSGRSSAPKPCRQIVLRSSASGAKTVTWKLSCAHWSASSLARQLIVRSQGCGGKDHHGECAEQENDVGCPIRPPDSQLAREYEEQQTES